MSDPLHPYAELYLSPKGPGDQRPTALKVLTDNDAAGSWQGRVVVVTGATSGIGVETARIMHASGADVFFTARDMTKAASTREDILKNSTGKGRLEVIEMNMDSLASVRRAAETFLSKSTKLNVLINNAGIMAPPKSKTQDGFERQFAVNHLAHYLLTRLLLPSLVSSSTPEFNSRVVNVSSAGHGASPVNFDDYNFDKLDSYQPFVAYGQSKTANIWTANYIDRVYGPKGVHALSLNPGGIATGLQIYVDPEVIKAWQTNPEVMGSVMSTEQGAATTVWAAAGKAWEGKGGKYLNNCGVAPKAPDDTQVLSSGGHASYAYSPDGEDRLWELSGKLVGVDD